MLKSLAILSLFFATIFAEDEGDNVGNCPELCTADNCAAWSSPTHKCSAYGVAVDPLLCVPEVRCFESSCDECGTQLECVEKCETWKERNNHAGYPHCRDACKQVPGHFKCWLPCNNPNKIAAREPDCMNYPCSEALCSARGRQLCSALDMLVDPYGYLNEANECAVVPCSSCGDQEECIENCQNAGGMNEEDCAESCRDIGEGDGAYKCLHPPPKE